MSLYDKINNVLDVEHFLNDTMLYVGGHLTWANAFDKYQLDEAELLEQAESITYWQDRYELATNEIERMVVRLQMRDNLIEGYRGCDREAIDEIVFKALIGTASTQSAIQRILPFAVDEKGRG